MSLRRIPVWVGYTTPATTEAAAEIDPTDVIGVGLVLDLSTGEVRVSDGRAEYDDLPDVTDNLAATVTTALAGKAATVHTHTASAVTDFDTQVRTSRIDQMTAPNTALSWPVGLTLTGLISASGTAGDGQVIITESSFFGGGLVSLYGNASDAQPKTSITGTGMTVGPGGASGADVSFVRSGTNAATITATSGVTIAGNLTLSARNIITDTTTGLKIGTSTSQKIGVYNKTPVAQPTTGITGATFVANSGTAINSASTFGGYTVAQIAAALINTGWLA